MPDAGEPCHRRPRTGPPDRAAVPDEPAHLMTAVQAAVLTAAMSRCARSQRWPPRPAAGTRSNVLHWAVGILRDPGGRVQANLSPEVFRQGIEQTVYTTYHVGQNVVWAYWMRTAF